MLNRPITYVWPTGGLTVQPGVQEIGADLYRVHPYVHSRDKTAIVLFGYVSNVADLVGRKVAEKRLQIDTGLEADDGDGGCDGGGPPTPTGNHDVGRLTASAILQLYLDSGPGNEKVVLSELQGAYAFVILDSSKKQAFAARDPSGGETLYYLLDDGAASFTHSLEALPPSELRAAWQELPPGHFIAGKPPRLQQFALTREQLMARDRQESMQSDEIAFFGEL